MNQRRRDGACFKCGERGHYANACPSAPNAESDEKTDGRTPSPSKKTQHKRKRNSINFLSAPQPPSQTSLIAARGTNVDGIEYDNIDRRRVVDMSMPPSQRRRLNAPFDDADTP